MNEKRFTYDYEDDNYYNKDFFKDNGKELYKDELLELLNTFHEENQSLKFQLKECKENKLFSRRELEREIEQLKQFKDKTFDLFDKEITRYEEVIEVLGKQEGLDVGAVGFYTNMLKILRKELEE